MPDPTDDKTADDIANLTARLADPDPELDADDTTHANLRVVRRNQYTEPQVATQGPTSIDPDQQIELHETLRSKIDFDAIPTPEGERRSVTIDIGTVTYNGDGDVVDYTIDPYYLTAEARDES